MSRDIVTAAMRCWRLSRDRGLAIQHRLHALVSAYHFEMLAPVLDSLMALYEVALGRRILCGEGRARSADEDMLLCLLDGSTQRRACLICPEGIGRSLDCAICSTRIMAALAANPPPGTSVE